MKEFLHNLVAKLRTKSFWVTVLGALTLLLSEIGLADTSAAAEQIAQIAGSVLLLFGIATSPAPADKEESEDESQENDTADGTKEE